MLVGITQVASRVGVSKDTVARWTLAGTHGFPPPTCLIGRHRRWDLAVIEQWMKDRENPPTPAPPAGSRALESTSSAGN